MNLDSGNIVLIGPMGSGKTTVGRCLAEKLNREFLDTDQAIESRCGADIPWIFDVEGEAGFRKRETALLQELCSQKNKVIATGGGIVLAEENRHLIANLGIAIHLTAPPALLFERVSKNSQRPLLKVDNPRATYEKIFRERQDLYRQTADITVDSSKKNIVSKTVDDILSRLPKGSGSQPS